MSLTNPAEVRRPNTARVRGGRGYLMIDNRHGDQALTVPLPNGETLVIGPGETAEMPTLTCAHCQVIVTLNPRRIRERAHCFRCNRYLCGKPGCRNECNPVEEMIELARRHPGQDWLGRGKLGEPLFDPKLREQARTY